MNPLTSLPRIQLEAWTSRPTAERIKVACEVGVTGLHLMVHDDAADRTENAWAMDRDVRESCKMITDAGLDLHLTAWAQPYTEYLSRACDDLVALAGEFGARSVCWDAEEPWTKGKGLPLQMAADAINLYGMTEGVTAIGYASRRVDPLVKRAAYVAPQCYVTEAPGGLDYADIDDVLYLWRRRTVPPVGKLPPDVVPAFAAYGQQSGGLVRAYMAAGKPDRVILWSMKHIANHPNEVRRLRAAMETN